MKILLLGASGQVGFELQRTLLALGDLIPATRSGRLPGGLVCLQANLADPASLESALDLAKADVIVNAAAYTAVDRAESESAVTQRVNGAALAQIGAWAERRHALVVHYSTDYVFDGQCHRPYLEDDATAPVSAYGRSKLAGETALRESGCAHLILRTAWIYGARGSNFLHTMLRLAGERDELRVVDDQFGAPTSSRLIAAATATALARWSDSDPQHRAGYNGIYHLSAAGETTWCRFARAIVARAHSAHLVSRSVPVHAINTQDFPTPARRPAYSVLDTGKLRKRFDVYLPDWTTGLDSVIGELVEMRATRSRSS